MPSYILDDSDGDDSGYTPCPQSLAELKRVLQLHDPLGQSLSRWNDDSSECTKRVWNCSTTSKATKPCILDLSLNNIQEIEDAAAFFDDTGLPLNMLKSSVFPLPKLSQRLGQLARDLPGKQPYFMLKGLKPQWYSKRKNVVIYLGIASHIGNKRAMAAGEADVLHHITDMPIPTSAEATENEAEVYRGPANRTMPIPFHNDYGEILSLFCLSTPFAGGAFYLADIHDIADRIANTRPDLLSTLRDDWVMVNPGIASGCDTRPVLFTLPSGNLAVHASRSRIFGTPSAPRPACLPPLSLQQVQAMDALHAAGREVSVRVDFEEGDMLFFNNMRMMHARDGFVDGDEEEGTTRRYLLRLIMRGGDGNLNGGKTTQAGLVCGDDSESEDGDANNDAAWEIPRELGQTWQELYGHRDVDEVVSVHEKLFSYKTSH